MNLDMQLIRLKVTETMLSKKNNNKKGKLLPLSLGFWTNVFYLSKNQHHVLAAFKFSSEPLYTLKNH
jgi:hypothetical protein